jgi:type III secretion protein S
MSPNVTLNQLTDAMTLVLLLSMPPILVASLAGLLIGLLQTLTQVQEQTISFAVKLIAVAITIAAMARLLGSEMLNYTQELFNNFPRMI